MEEFDTTDMFHDFAQKAIAHSKGRVLPDRFNGIEINSEFNQALDALDERQNIFLTGPGGVGKSIFIDIVKYLYRYENVITLAPTGVAANRVGGETIHGFFKFRPELLHMDTIKLDSTSNVAGIVRHLDLLIIDECSMVRADLIQAIDIILRYYKASDLPFGGIQVLLVGDPFQLPPIAKTQIEKNYLTQEFGGSFFFNSHAFKDGNFRHIEFTKIYRQSEKTFSDILNRIRVGTYNRNDLKIINECVIEEQNFSTKSNDDYIYISTMNKVAEEVNSIRLLCIPNPQYTFCGQASMGMNWRDVIAQEILHLKTDAKIMLLNNDSEKRWINGTVGKVDYVDDRHIEVKLNNGMVVSVLPYTWEKKEYTLNGDRITSKTSGTLTQFPLKLSWAITAHKSQSSTYDRVYINLSNVFEAGQTYVALSRCKSLEGLGMKQPLSFSDIIIKKEVLDFYSTL